MKDKRTSSKNSGFVSKLSKGLMLPIALLPIAGMFLGVGSGIVNIMISAGVPTNSPWYIIPQFMSSIGNIIFANLPILFAIGVAIAFTNDAGVAGFSAFVGWIVFCTTQSMFIWEQDALVAFNSKTALAPNSNTQLFVYYYQNSTTNWNDILNQYQPFINSGIGTVSVNPELNSLLDVDQNHDGYIDVNEVNYALVFGTDGSDAVISSKQYGDFIAWFNQTPYVYIDGGEQIIPTFASTSTYYNIFFYTNVPTSVITSNVGILSMQTSVFGGITVGLITAWIYNKFYKLQMPKALGFFSGTKSVPIIVFLFMPLIGFFFLFTWPPIGNGLEAFGEALGSVPYGIDAFIFGIVERSLVPFGLHHAFYTPLWFTSAGGSFYVLNSQGQIVDSAYGNQYIWFAFINYQLNFNSLTGPDYWYPFTTGTTFADGAINLSGGAWGQFTDGSYWIYHPDGTNGMIPTSDYYFVVTAGVNPGSYMQGKYSFMIFGLPAAAMAIVMTAKKENREMVMSIVFAAALTSFLTGITEPLEFTFLFVAPQLYFFFHVPMCGISFWVADLLNVSMGMTFSGGIIDFALYGILPWATGIQGVEWWWPVALGLLYIPIYYFFFYWYITTFDVKTPGREDDDNTTIKLVSKAEYQAARAGPSSSNLDLSDSQQLLEIFQEAELVDEQNRSDNLLAILQEELSKSDKFNELTPDRKERVAKLLIYLGGFENLEIINACVTKLRLVVYDRTKVEDDKIIKDLKASAVVGKGRNLQVVFGTESDLLRSEILDIKKELDRKTQQ